MMLVTWRLMQAGTRRHRRIAARQAALGAVALLAPVAARAQTPSPLAEWQYSAGIPLERMFDPTLPVWQTELGLGAQFAPTYDGAQRYRVEPGPSIDVRYRDLWFASTGEGVGVNVVGSEHVRAGVAISYDLGREVNEDSSRLHGLGSIAPAPEAKLFAEYSVARSLPLVVRVDVRRAVGGANGVICDLGAYLPMPGSGQHFFWLAGPSMSFADATYMNRYFGIGAAQALRSGDARYKADAGLKSAGFGVSATWFVSRHWLVNSTAAFTQLLGSAARSPITEAASEGVLTLAVTYRF